jgi:hypothetical protein
MRFSESEIVEDILEHIRQAGGEYSEWHVGTANGSGRPRLQRAETENLANALICREAYTTYVADEVVDRLTGFGLRPDRTSVAEPGKTVFVYRPTTSKNAEGPVRAPQPTASWR